MQSHISIEESEIACVGLNITLSKDEFNAKTLSKTLDNIRTTVTTIERMLTQ